MDSLEKEILRLKLEQKDREQKLERQWGKLRHNFGSMLFQSFKKKKPEEEKEKDGLFDETIHTISDKISGKVSDVVSTLFNRFFKK